MSSDFYFRFFSTTLDRLEKLVKLDLNYQITKYHDQLRCDAAQRLIGVLAEYHTVYNDQVECNRGNLQVQKTGHIDSLVHAVVARINELNHQIRKLEASQNQFFGHGLVMHRITPDDTELTEVPTVLERPEFVEKIIEDAFQYAKAKLEEKDKLAHEEAEHQDEAPTEVVDRWWEDEVEEVKTVAHAKFAGIYEVKEKVDEETLKRNALVALIQAHEKTRQVTQWYTQRNERRILWTKELRGENNPEARPEIKVQSAALIQKVIREYFKLKRKRIADLRRDHLLGLDYHQPWNKDGERDVAEIQIRRSSLRKKYLNEWKSLFEELKQKHMDKRASEIAEDFREGIRHWFLTWYNEVKTFYAIPNERDGGSSQIVKEEVPSPSEWWDQYQAHLDQLKSNKNKSFMQKKLEQRHGKKESNVDKSADKKNKMEEAMQKKIMKNPKMHPGFTYPESKQTEHIFKEIKKYRKDWGELDATGSEDVKRKFIKQFVEEDAWCNVKEQVIHEVDEDMRKELKLLKKALKKDYQITGEKIPEMKKRTRRTKKKRIRAKPSQHVVEQMKELAVKSILTDVPKTKITDFIGDHNFAGNDYRCMYKPAEPYSGETRRIWWEHCREVVHGFRTILLVGPEGSGKTTLIHSLASSNEACLFVLDPSTISEEFLSSVYLEQVIKHVVACARAAQPSVIFIRHVQRLFYKKVPPEEKDRNLDMKKKYLIRYLFKRIQKKDNVTIIGTCVNPWMAKTKVMLKKFTNVVLMPNSNYTTIVKLLKSWVLNHHTLPRDMDVHSLAWLLQGYRFSFLQDALNNFMSAENIVKIAAHGLTNQAIFEYILEYGKENIIDYQKYLKWYTERTPAGQREQKQLESQLEFKARSEQLEAKKKKKKRRSSKSSKRWSPRGSRSSKVLKSSRRSKDIVKNEINVIE